MPAWRAGPRHLLDRLADRYTVIAYGQLGVKFLLGAMPCDNDLSKHIQLYEAEGALHVARLGDHSYRDSALAARGLLLHDIPVEDGRQPSKACLEAWGELVRGVQARNCRAAAPRERAAPRGRRGLRRDPPPAPLAEDKMECIVLQTVQLSSAAFMIALALHFLHWDYNSITRSLWERLKLGLSPLQSVYLKGLCGRRGPR